MDKISKDYPVFSKRCFWENNYYKLNFNTGKQYVITKVISYGSQNDYIELFKYYGWEVIKNEVVKIKYLNKKVLNFLSILFETNINDFRAYKNRNIF